MREVTEAVLALLERGQRGALATVVRTSGSTPQQPGARMLLLPGGRTVGTVGGGAIEQAVREALESCLADGKPCTLERDLGRDLAMCCGGRMEIFVEPVEAPSRLFLFGAGHVAAPTAALARTVGYEVTVVDDRDELLTEERFPECKRVRGEPGESVGELGLTDQDTILILTHDHRLDEEALDACLRAPHRYLGMIGSRRKVFKILQRIHARAGLPSLDRVYSPVGLDIGAVSPAEIAVSIVAELVALRHGSSGPHMRAVNDPLLHKVLDGQIPVEAVEHLETSADGE